MASIDEKLTFELGVKNADKVKSTFESLKHNLEIIQKLGPSAANKEYPQIIKEIDRDVKKLSSTQLQEIGVLKQLDAEQNKSLLSARAFHEEMKKSSGLSANISKGLGDVAARFGQIFTVAGAATAVIALLQKMSQAVADFAKEASAAAAGEEYLEARLARVLGSAEEGAKAFEKYEDATHNAAFSMKKFSDEEYLANVAKGGRELGEVYLNTVTAGEAFGFSTSGLMQKLNTLDEGLKPKARSWIEFRAVLDEANMSVQKNGDFLDRTTGKMLSTAEASDKLKATIADMAGGAGLDGIYEKSSYIKNKWQDIKEAIGTLINYAVKPLLDFFVKLLKHQEDWGNLWKLLKDQILPIVVVLVKDLVTQLEGMLTVIRLINTAAGYLSKPFEALSNWIDKADNKFRNSVLGRYILLQTGDTEAAFAKDNSKAAMDRARGGGRTPTEGADWEDLSAADKLRIAKEQGYGSIEAYEDFRSKTEEPTELYKKKTPGGRGGGGRVTPEKPIPIGVKLTGHRRGRGAQAEEAGVAGVVYDYADEKKRQEELLATAEKIGELINPTDAIIAGLKSGDMKTAVQDFAIGIGEAVARELMSALIMAGVLAVLNMLSGGATGGIQMALGSGGVIRAAEGFIGTLPAVPGGHYLKYGNKFINAAERGRNELMAILPDGARGRDLVLNQLAPRFGIPTVNVDNKNVFQPSTHVTVTGMDPHHTKATANVDKGTANRAVNVRSAKVKH